MARQYDTRSIRVPAERPQEMARLAHGKAPDAHAEQLEHAPKGYRLTGLNVDDIDVSPATATSLNLTDPRRAKRRKIGALLIANGQER